MTAPSSTSLQLPNNVDNLATISVKVDNCIIELLNIKQQLQDLLPRNNTTDTVPCSHKQYATQTKCGRPSEITLLCGHGLCPLHLTPAAIPDCNRYYGVNIHNCGRVVLE